MIFCTWAVIDLKFEKREKNKSTAGENRVGKSERDLTDFEIIELMLMMRDSMRAEYMHIRDSQGLFPFPLCIFALILAVYCLGCTLCIAVR